MTEGTIWKQLLLFFFPLLIGTFFQQLYNTVDAMIVGRIVGKQALSAVGGTTGVILNLFLGSFIGLSSGATVIIAQFFGARKSDEVRRTVGTSYALSIAAGMIITFFGIIFSPAMLRVMNTPADIYSDALVYMRIYFLGMTVNLVYNMGAGILRAVGDSRRPLYYLIIACLLNAVLDLLFVAVFHMGVAGAAIATVLCQLISAILVTAALVRTHDSYRLEPRCIRLDAFYLKRIVQIGIPAAVESLTYSFSNVIIQTSINWFGTDTIAAWTAYGKIDVVFWMIMNSFGIAIVTFTGQNFGAGNKSRVRSGIRQGALLIAASTALLCLVLLLSGKYILGIFTADANVIAIGSEMIRFLVPLFFTYMGVEVFSSALRGLGNTLVPMLLSCFGVCGIRLLWLFFVLPLHRTLAMTLACYPITWGITSIMFIIYFEISQRKEL